ncbi:thiosulfate sulfurtransferase [Crocosphaera subtropica ATCC 51142]|uniref:Thiosulfate sulfurtransferase n=1 Tax=Crocosphaera subtropica (strain ATCC 51142 / BH68) TaxID=43989 RepID=B1WY82_CROS5|nr:sulfurtransferase [Crocosphaera subtropica]ACB52666.1 thiosulfate sulfurtransferase [Crocosphaera subtropica ATCC 51142]
MSNINSLISSEWLTGQLPNPNLVIIDCRFRLGDPNWGYEEYLTSHIPGAYYLNLDQDLSSSVTSHGGRHPLPNPSIFAKKLESMGIQFGETVVIAYDDLRFAFAARLWWLLRYFGHEQVAVLDGGWPGWQAKGYPVDNVTPKAKLGHFVPEPRTDWIVDIETLKQRKDSPNVIVIDSRDSDRYRGEREPIDPIAGHIQGAINSPWKCVTNDEGYMLPEPEQKGLWADFEGFKEIIVYCGSGVTACVNLLSMESVGIKGAKLYPGGWSDWCSYLVET